MVLTVKEAAARLGLSEHTVRFYTDKGLVPTLQRDRNNNRLFDEASLNWLTGVKYLKECGMPLEEIRRYVELCLEGDATAAERYQIILRQQEAARRQLEEARTRLDYLEHKAALYRDILAHQLPDVMNPGTWPARTAM